MKNYSHQINETSSILNKLMKYSYVIKSTRLRLVFCYNLFTVFKDVSRGNAKINGEKCGKGDHLVEKTKQNY